MFNDIQSKRGNQRDGFNQRDWHIWILLRILTVQKLWAFNLFRGLVLGLLDEFSIGIFRPFYCEVWKRSDSIFWKKIPPALEPFQNKDSSLVLLFLGTVNGELILFQNRSKKRFWRRQKDDDISQVTVIQRLINIDLYTYTVIFRELL